MSMEIVNFTGAIQDLLHNKGINIATGFAELNVSLVAIVMTSYLIACIVRNRAELSGAFFIIAESASNLPFCAGILMTAVWRLAAMTNDLSYSAAMCMVSSVLWNGGAVMTVLIHWAFAVDRIVSIMSPQTYSSPLRRPISIAFTVFSFGATVATMVARMLSAADVTPAGVLNYTVCYSDFEIDKKYRFFFQLQIGFAVTVQYLLFFFLFIIFCWETRKSTSQKASENCMLSAKICLYMAALFFSFACSVGILSAIGRWLDLLYLVGYCRIVLHKFFICGYPIAKVPMIYFAGGKLYRKALQWKKGQNTSETGVVLLNSIEE